jgi:hypothetical protein
MGKFFRSVLVVLVFAFQSGCASYRPATIPSEAGSPQSVAVHDSSDSKVAISPEGGAGDVVRAGSKVRIELIGGGRVEGEVLRVSVEEIVIRKVGNYGLEERSILAGEIAVLEVRHESSGTNYVAGGLAVVLTVFLVAIALTVL